MNAAIVYLTRKQDINLLVRSLRLLNNFFIDKFQYPVIILEDDLDNTDKEQIKLSLNDIKIKNFIQFENISFSLPHSLSLDSSLYHPPLDEFKMGYRSMCHFFAGEIFNHKLLQKYDWIWRLDSDSYILNPIDYDPFEYMKQNNKVYGYISEYMQDQPYVVEGLFETTKQFVEQNNIKPNSILQQSLTNGWNSEMFYTNFEIINTKFIKKAGYMKYYEFLNLTNNIFYKRWGDAPIRWLGINMVAQENEIYCIKDISYQHQHWIKNI
jgi:hypothetical protein